MTVDIVAQWGRDLARLERAFTEAENQKLAAKEDASECLRLDREMAVLDQRMEAIKAIAATTRATSLEGAMVQIAIAHVIIDSMTASVYTDRQTEEARLQLNGLLYSAFGVLRDLAGADPDDQGLYLYMQPDHDPHKAGQAVSS